MHADILTWLSSDRDYAAGVLLFEKHGNNSVLLKMMKARESIYTSEKLLEELLKISKEKPPVRLDYKSHPQKKVVERPPAIAVLPEALQKKVKIKNMLYAEVNNLRPKLLLVSNKATRYKIARQILDAQQRIKDIWYEIDYYNEHGVEMMTNQPEGDNFAKMAKRLALLPGYIRRYKDDSDRKDLYEKYVAEEAELKIKLNA